MRQGEVWTLPSGVRAVVVSADVFNEQPRFRPVVAPIVRAHGEPEGLAVPLHPELDHIGNAVVLVHLLTNIAPVAGDPDTTLTGQTMHRVVTAVEELFSY